MLYSRTASTALHCTSAACCSSRAPQQARVGSPAPPPPCTRRRPTAGWRTQHPAGLSLPPPTHLDGQVGRQRVLLAVVVPVVIHIRLHHHALPVLQIQPRLVLGRVEDGDGRGHLDFRALGQLRLSAVASGGRRRAATSVPRGQASAAGWREGLAQGRCGLHWSGRALWGAGRGGGEAKWGSGGGRLSMRSCTTVV